MLVFCRFTSRAVLVPFECPSVCPASDEEEEAFMELDSIISSGELSSSIAWAIGCGNRLSHDKDEIREFCSKLKGSFSGRVLKNWGTLLYFLNKVRDNMIPHLSIYAYDLYAAAGGN